MCYWTYWINLVLVIQIPDVADPSLHFPQKVLIWLLYAVHLLKQTQDTYIAITFIAFFCSLYILGGHSCLEQIRRLILKYWKNNARSYWRRWNKIIMLRNMNLLPQWMFWKMLPWCIVFIVLNGKDYVEMKNGKFSQPDLLAVTIKSNFILFFKRYRILQKLKKQMHRNFSFLHLRGRKKANLRTVLYLKTIWGKQNIVKALYVACALKIYSVKYTHFC